MARTKLGGRASEWTTNEQKEWLERCKPAHLAAQSKGPDDLRLFWADTFEKWLVMWPLGEPTAEEKAKGVYDMSKMTQLKKVSHHYISYSRILSQKKIIAGQTMVQ